MPALVTAVPAGQAVPFTVERDGKQVTVRRDPAPGTGTRRSASRSAPTTKFPFDVAVGIADNIGGPSAGLMFRLASTTP